MSDWRTKDLGDLAHFISGGTPSKANAAYWGGDIPWISAASLTARRLRTSDRNVTQAAIGNGTKIEPKGTTLLLVRGMSLHQEIRLGRAWRPLAFNQDVKALRAKPGVDEAFLYYALDSKRQELLEMVHAAGHGTGVLATDRLKTLPVETPVEDEQRRIASVLSGLDDLIEKEQDLAAEIDGLWRALLRDSLNETERRPLSELAAFVNGKNFTRDATGTGLPVIRTPEVRTGPGTSTVWNDVSAGTDNQASVGDILFVWSGSLLVGRWLWETGLVNQHVFKVLPKDNVPPWVVYWSIEQLMASFLGIAADKATTMGHIKREDLDREVDLPPRRRWAELDAVIGPLWDEALQARLQAASLGRMRDELLPLLMSGKVRVQDLEGVERWSA